MGEIISVDNNLCLYEFVLPTIRFPCTHTKSEVIKHPKISCKSFELKMTDNERELLKHVFIHGNE